MKSRWRRRAESTQRKFHAELTESKSPLSGGGCRPSGPTHGSRGGARTNGRCDGRHSFAHLLSIHPARSAAPTASQTLRLSRKDVCLSSLWTLREIASVGSARSLPSLSLLSPQSLLPPNLDRDELNAGAMRKGKEMGSF